jgi:UDP:flavonoid glycosyltransferase YjiC (YdhE family)
MRIAIVATGSRGDVEPYVALGKGLNKAGYSVRLITHQNFGTLVKSNGLDFWSIESNVQDIAQSKEMSERIEKGSFLSVMAQMKKEAERGAINMAETGLDACKDADLILAGVGGLYVGIDLAEKFNLPLVQAYYIPFLPTKAYPSFLFAKLPSLGGYANRLSHHIVRQIMWQSFKSADKKARKILGLPNAPFWGPYKNKRLKDSLVLYGVSPQVIEPAADAGTNVCTTGHWFLEPEPDWQPPQELVDFIEAGPAPVYVGFGSMSSKNPKQTTDLILEAFKETKQRAIMLSGWGGLDKKGLPDSVFMVDSVPFSWLFPRMAAVVHHGGAGTTALGLRAGVPSIIIPFFADQPFWGSKVAKLGAGPKPIPRRKLTAKRLAESIEMALTDQTLRQNAAKIGSAIRSENGVKCAVELIQKYAPKLAD